METDTDTGAEAMPKGNLAVGRITGKEGKYIVFLVSIEDGRPLEQSKDFTETELRAFLAENYKLSESEIEALIIRAKASPEI
jgi:hypothetical protein